MSKKVSEIYRPEEQDCARPRITLAAGTGAIACRRQTRDLQERGLFSAASPFVESRIQR